MPARRVAPEQFENRLVVLFLIIGVLVAGAVAFAVFRPQSSIIENVVKETGSPLDGTIFLEDQSLGVSQGGRLTVPREQLRPGAFYFITNYAGREHNLTYMLTEEDIDGGLIRITTEKKILDSYDLTFTEVATDRPMLGEVYLDEEFLGRTVNGRLDMDIYDLHAGTIELRTPNVNYTFTLEPTDFTYSGMEFIVFDATNLDREKIEAGVASLVNEQRRKKGLEQYEVRDTLVEAARMMSAVETDDMPAELLEKQRIYFLTVSWVMSYAETDEHTTEQSMAEALYEYIMLDQSNRVYFVEDEESTAMGVGVHCEGTVCDATILAILADETANLTFENACNYYMFYDPESPNAEGDITIELTATEPIGIYVVEEDSTAVDDCLDGDDIPSIKEYGLVQEIDDTIHAEYGQGLLFDSYDESDVELTLHYLE